MLVLYEKGIEILKNKISNKEEIFWENYNLVNPTIIIIG